MTKELKLTILSFFISVFAFLAKYVFNVFLANYLPVALYGDINIAFRSLGVFSELILLGTQVTAKRFLSRYISLNDTNQALRYLHWNLKLVLLSVLGCCLVATSAAFLYYINNNVDFNIFKQYHLAFSMLWVAPIAGFSIILASFLSSGDYPVTSYGLSTVGKYILLITFFAISIFFFESSLDTPQILIVTSLTFLVLAIIEIYLISAKTPIFDILFKHQVDYQKIKIKDKNTWLQVSIRLILNNIVFLLSCMLDLIVVEVFASSENAVGYYSAVLAISGALWIIPQGIFQFIKPKISGAISTPDGKRFLQTTFNHLNMILFVISTLSLIILLYFSNGILLHFGKPYLVAKTALIITLFANYIGGFSKAPGSLLVYTGYEKLLLKVNIAYILMLLIATIPLTFYFGIVGTSLGVLIAVGIQTFVAFYYSKRKTGISFF